MHAFCIIFFKQQIHIIIISLGLISTVTMNLEASVLWWRKDENPNKEFLSPEPSGQIKCWFKNPQLITRCVPQMLMNSLHNICQERGFTIILANNCYFSLSKYFRSVTGSDIWIWNMDNSQSSNYCMPSKERSFQECLIFDKATWRPI